VKRYKKIGEVIAVANQKGGVGKTTTSVNLSASLAIAEKKVLLLDFDPQANTTTGLGVDKYSLKKDVYQWLNGEAELSEVVQKTELDYLFVLPSSRGLARFELEIEEGQSGAVLLRQMIGAIDENFDYVIVDSPPSLGLLTINALTAADSVLIPIQAEYYALEGLSDLINTVNRVKETFNPELEIKGIVLTMFDDRTNLSRQVEKEVRSYFKTKVFSSVIPRNIRLSEAPSFGKPIQLYAIKSTGSLAYLNLAKEILE
jgi:chromosome partitioning protein